MEKKHIIIRIFQTVILCGLVWICFIITRLTLNHASGTQEIFVPESASSTISIKADTLVGESFGALLFNRDDKEQMELITALKTKFKTNSESREWNYGIDLANDIQIFSDQINGKELQGFIFRLNDTSQWDENSSKLLTGNVFASRKGTTGLVLNSNSATPKELKLYFKKRSFSKKTKIASEPLSFEYKTKKNHSIKKIDARFKFKENYLFAHLSSDFRTEIEIGKRKFELDDGGLHIQSSYIPNTLTDTINYFARKHQLSIPQIRSIDLKYDGIELASSNSGILPLPTVEAIIEFETSFSISQLINKIAENDPKSIKFDEKSFEIAKKTYFFKQLDAKTIYIGSTNKPKIITPKTHDLISISGDLRMLSNVQGSRFVTGFVKMNDSYQKLESILSRFENIDIRINRKGEANLVGSGKLSFVDKKKTMNELLKILLTLA